MLNHPAPTLADGAHSLRRTARLRRRVMRAGALCVVVSMAASGPVSAADADRARLAETQRAIEQTLAELQEVSGRAAQSQAALAEAEAAVDALEQALNDLLAEVEAQEARVDAAQLEADQALAEALRIEGLINARARQAFMGGTPSAFSVLTGQSGNDLSGALDQIAMLDALAARDAASIETLGAARIQAEASAARLEEALVELADARETQERLLAEAEQVFAARETAVATLSSERERLLANQERLEDEADSIQSLIAREEAARRAAEDAARQAPTQPTSSVDTSTPTSTPEPAPEPPPPATGCYQKPAAGAVTSEYGPRWGRMHAGMDIDGDTGDSIVAAQSGTVTFVGWQGGYGQLTLIRHSDGVTTAYAHQSSVGVSSGQTVSRGEFIGRIGTTGNVTGSHLHFETRTSSGAKNPRNYLC